MKILFVCLGNICRSPLAQGIAENMSTIHYFDSAGISAYHQGSLPCEGSLWVAQKHGISLTHIRSRPIVFPQDDQFDWIIALDSQNQKDLIHLGFDEKKVKKLGEFGLDGLDIPDPYYYVGFEGFEKIFSMIECCVQNLLRKLDV